MSPARVIISQRNPKIKRERKLFTHGEKLLLFAKNRLTFPFDCGKLFPADPSRSIFGGIAQLVEHSLDVRRVRGSSPFASTRKRQIPTGICRFQLYSPCGELYAPSVRDICFASDMPAGVRGEYNITETAGFNITFCAAKYITPSKTEYH